MTIAEAIRYITEQLAADIDTARLDAELIVAAGTQLARAQLYAYPERIVSKIETQRVEELLQRRLQGEPMAYLLGYQEFWSLRLQVTRDTLIPRPETEQIVEWVLDHFTAKQALKLADLGTGSGAIAMALAHERPQWHIDATDQSVAALQVAQHNAQTYHLHSVSFYQGNWCEGLPSKDYDVIISNPPYIAVGDPHLAALSYEPATALVSGATGLDAIHTIINQVPHYLRSGGYLVLEHGYHQAMQITDYLHRQDFVNIESHVDLAGLPRFITACLKR